VRAADFVRGGLLALSAAGSILAPNATICEAQTLSDGVHGTRELAIELGLSDMRACKREKPPTLFPTTLQLEGSTAKASLGPNSDQAAVECELCE